MESERECIWPILFRAHWHLCWSWNDLLLPALSKRRSFVGGANDPRRRRSDYGSRRHSIFQRAPIRSPAAWHHLRTRRLVSAPRSCRQIAMKWITREKVKVDRVACPWLIKKFIDPDAQFFFVPANEVNSRAIELRATPFDIKDCELGHHGEDVSFNSILKKYRLNDPALALLGEIVRAADSHPSNPHPAGEGLRWIASGFSALDLGDHEILTREFPV